MSLKMSDFETNANAIAAARNAMEITEMMRAQALIAQAIKRERTRIIWVFLAAMIICFVAGFWVGHPTWGK